MTALDSFTDGDQAWVCVFAAETSTSTEFGKRVVIPFPGEDAVEAVRFEQDDPAAPAPVPDPAPIDPTFASATCQTGTGGTYQRVLNSDLGGEHVWLDAWQESDTRAHLCVRLQGTADLGGRLSVDALGTGLTPVHDSEHSHECMSFEYRTAYAHLRRGGVLASDDVRWNTAFAEFAERHSLAVRWLGAGLAFVIV